MTFSSLMQQPTEKPLKMQSRSLNYLASRDGLYTCSSIRPIFEIYSVHSYAYWCWNLL